MKNEMIVDGDAVAHEFSMRNCDIDHVRVFVVMCDGQEKLSFIGRLSSAAERHGLSPGELAARLFEVQRVKLPMLPRVPEEKRHLSPAVPWHLRADPKTTKYYVPAAYYAEAVFA